MEKNNKVGLFESASNINKFICVIPSVILVLSAMLKGNREELIRLSIMTFVLIAVVYLSQKFSDSDKIKSLVPTISIVIFYSVQCVYNDGLPHYLSVMIATVLMSALYFDVSILKCHIVMMNLIILVVAFMTGFNLVGDGYPVNSTVMELCALLIVQVTGYLIVKSVSELLNKAMSDRDSATSTSSKLLTTFNVLENSVEVLSKTFKDMSGVSSGVTNGSSVVSDNIKTLDSNLKSQISCLEYVSKCLALVKTDVEESFELSTSVDQLGVSLDDMTDVSRDKVVNLMNNIDIMYNSSSKAKESVVEFSGTMEAFKETIKSVNNIAKQTNLLALNASIESEKAGEYGKSFGVVATEIRKLSLEVADTTKSIEDLLNQGALRLNSIISDVNKSLSVTEEGKCLSEEVRDSFFSMDNVIHTMSDKIKEEHKLLDTVNEQVTKVVKTFDKVNSLTDISNVSLKKVSDVQTQQGELINSLSNNLKSMDKEIHSLNEVLS